MKHLRLLLLLIIALRSLPAQSQSFLGGFFNQNSTQIQYYLQQIAATQAYGSDLNKGYNIVKNGTGAIGGIKSSELALHQNHFDSLKIVSPKVRSYSRIKAIMSLQQQIIAARDLTYPQLSVRLTSREAALYNQAYSVLLDEGSKDLAQLQLVITDGKLQMTDDERIAAINRLYAAMSGRYGAMQRLNSNWLAVAAQRNRDSRDATAMEALH